jgi:hypothetical protein
VLTGLPPRVVFVDPGTRKGHGVATFWSGELVSADLTTDNVIADAARHAVVEMPAEAFGGTVNTIVNLARAAERAVARYTIRNAVTYVHPSGTHAWKRGSKAQHQYNAWHALDEREQTRIAFFCRDRKLRGLGSEKDILDKLQERCQRESRGPKPGEWVLGNVLDAVFMGLWATGRIDEYGRR